MDTYTCPECERSFKSALALAGHKRVHSSPLYNPPKVDKRITCQHTGRRIRPHNWEAYQARLRTCQNPACSKIFENLYNAGLYCSQSCSATVENKKRVRTDESKQKTSESLRDFYGSPEHKVARLSRAKEIKTKLCEILPKECPQCSKVWYVPTKLRHQKNCSTRCANEASSIRMTNKIIGDSAGNFSLKQYGFTHEGITIDCDSKLETAGVKYLVDVMGATSIERCRSILNYKDPEGNTHRFLPDFYARIGDERYIVEVKQVWKKSAKINKYNRYFDEKRNALKDFAAAKGLKSLWLDFDYDPHFEKIYQKVLKR